MAPPGGWRHAVFAPEGPDEGGVGLVADVFGDARQRRVAAAQQVGREHHAPLDQVLHGRAAHQVLEALGLDTSHSGRPLTGPLVVHPREATILRFRFGLDGGTEKTLEEVGEKFGVTRERVRQIQNIALRKLRKMIEKLEAKKK